MEIDSIASRLKQFMDYKELSNSQFADACGIPRPNLSQLLSGRNKKVSDVLIGQIHKAYPDLSIVWLLFGEGLMLVTNVSSDNDSLDCQGEAELYNNGDVLKNGNSSDQNLYNGENTINSGFENAEIPDNHTQFQNGKNLNPLNRVADAMQQCVNKEKSNIPDAVELAKQIDKLKKNPRKVVQIMVYYDDSTFETFYPDVKR